MKTLLISVSFTFLFIRCAFGQTQQQIDNQATFTKLYGYIRYFHPSDEAAGIDWNRFAIYGSKKVASCSTAGDLKRVLTELFDPIVPGLQIYQAGRKPAFNAALLIPADTVNYKTVSWQHVGVGLIDDKRSLYKSFRTNRPAKYTVERSPFGSVNKVFNADQYQGKQFEFKGRLKVAEGDGSGHLWVRVDRANNKIGFFNNMIDRPVVTKDWQEFKISGVIDKDGVKINTGVFLLGRGTLYCDDLSFSVKDGNKEKVVYTLPFSTDTTGKLPSELFVGIGYSNSSNPSYSFEVMDAPSSPSDKWLAIKSVEDSVVTEAHQQSFPSYPRVGEYLDKPIGEGLSVMTPLALYGTATDTYPSTNKDQLLKLKEALEEIEPATISGSDLYTRLADVTITWNVFQHFFPYFDVAQTNWPKDLETAIGWCYRDQTTADFANTLRKLTAKLKDGHISVSSLASQASAFLPPVSWEWIEGKLVITNVLSREVKLSRGDLVLEINGQDPKEYFKETEQYISAATEGWLQYRAATESLKGRQNSVMKLKIENASNRVYDISLNRSMTTGDYYAALPAAEVIKTISPGLVYVNIGKAKMEEINKALPMLKQSKGIICDLRGYPMNNTDFIEYLMSEPDTSSQWMQIPHIIYPDQERIAGYEKEGWSLRPREPHLTAKVVFLIDGQAISYAESYLSFIEHYKLATLVGQPTAGTNGNVNILYLPASYTIRWTGMKVLKHDGSRHHGVGIIPDVYVEKTIKGIREGRDEFLEKALQIIKDEK